MFSIGVLASECPSVVGPSVPAVSDFLKGCASGTAGIEASSQPGIDAIRDRVRNIAVRAIELGALLAVGFIVFSGFRYTTSYGDDEKVKHAKSTAIYAIIGLIILMGAYGFVDVIIGFIYSIGA